MKEKFYQACYTRVGMQEGWRTINFSQDIPQHILTVFEKTEAGNEVKRGIPLDVKGNALWMLEVICDKDYIGLSRTQYGLSDAFGRSNFFCNGYLFANAYELLKNPNYLLSISDDNFKTSIEETKEIPEELLRRTPLNLEDALHSCGMTKETYIRYIQCVYYALSTNTNNTIYVCTDGNDDTARHILYLTYCAIPYSLRSKVTASTCPEIDGTNKMLVFCTKIPEYSRFVNPRTGDNNILTPAIEKRWKRNPFVSYFAEHWENQDGNEKIYREIEKWLGEMGDITLNSMDALLLAYTMCGLDLDTAQDEEIVGLLYDWLALPVENSEVLESHIVTFLDKVVERQIKMGQEAEQLLSERYATAMTKEMREAYLGYLSFALIQMQRADSCGYLRNLGKESSVFVRLRELLKTSVDGKTLLYDFYLENMNALLESQECTYEDLIEMYYDCEDLEEIIGAVQDSLHQKNLELAKNELWDSGAFREIKMRYKETEESIKRRWKAPIVLFEEYDRYIQEKFNVENIPDYDWFYSKVSGFDLMKNYLASMHALEVHDYKMVEEYLCSELAEQLNLFLIDILFNYALEHCASAECISWQFWKKFSELKNVEIIQLLIKNQVEVFCNPERFERSLLEDEYWRDTDFVKKFYEKCLRYMEKRGEKEFLLECCNLLKIELKERKIEQKRLEKEASKRENGKTEKKGHFDKQNIYRLDGEDKDSLSHIPKEKPKHSATSAMKNLFGFLKK